MKTEVSEGALGLRRWRKRKGLTQARASAFLEISQTGLSKLEGGQRKPSLKVAWRIELRTDGDVVVASWSRAAHVTAESVLGRRQGVKDPAA